MLEQHSADVTLVGDDAPSEEEFVLTLSCIDRAGIVSAVSGVLFESGANIVEAHQFNDKETKYFFARISFTLTALEKLPLICDRISCLAVNLDMRWDLLKPGDKARVLLLVSKFDHCLSDILYRWRIGEIRMDVVGIVSNHSKSTFKHLDFEGIPFTFLPITAGKKAEQERALLQIVKDRKVDLVVLARYMQILSSNLASELSGRCINIHHSFLPGFKGAKPYHQAYARGVKVIGATAHYVTEDLDEGPIIEQDVERISHYDMPDALIRKGRDVERRVLSKAIAWHLDRRVILHGAKTIVFRD